MKQPSNQFKSSLPIFAVVLALSVMIALGTSFRRSNPVSIVETSRAEAHAVRTSRNVVAHSQIGAPFDLSSNAISGGGGRSSNGATSLEGTLGQIAGTPMIGGVFTLNGGWWTGVLTATPTPTPTPTPDPSALVIFVEQGTVNQAVALDSVTLVRGPFRILTDHNFSGDHHTRVIIFTSPLGLTQPNSSVLSVTAGGISLTVENVGPVTGVAGLNGSFIVVRLPDNLPSGDLPLLVALNGVSSINSPTFSISP